MSKWTSKTKNESDIESNGFHSRIEPILNKISDSWSTYEPDTDMQKNKKVDGIMKMPNSGRFFYFENKVVNGEYDRIFAEYLAVPDYSPPKKGWMEISSRVSEPTILFYAMTNTVYAYNLDKIKSWYKKQDKSKWIESKYYDKVFKQTMYGYLIPIKELEPFLISKFRHS